MDGGQHSVPAMIEAQALGQLMPMFVWISPIGHIREAGPTLIKLFAGSGLTGRRFFDVFEMVRPHAVTDMAGLTGLAGRRLHLALHTASRTAFRGLAAPMAGDQGMLINLSFGISLADAVRDHSLTDADFAATDLAVELLYLQEAKSAVMTELNGMNDRLKAARAAAEEQAVTDPLTGLTNRRGLELDLTMASDKANKGGQPFALAHIDLDFFKSVNDTMGHAAGDHVLMEVARILREETRSGDVVARVGGDEFVLLLRDLVDPKILHSLAARIIEKFEAPILFDGDTCQISGSVGVTTSALYDVRDPDRMLTDADLALYASKHKGRAQCTMFKEGMTLPEDMRSRD